MRDLLKFDVKFVETSKYNEVERTNRVEVVSKASAENLIHATFGSFKTSANMFGIQTLVPSGKVRILKTTKVKETK